MQRSWQLRVAAVSIREPPGTADVAAGLRPPRWSCFSHGPDNARIGVDLAGGEPQSGILQRIVGELDLHDLRARSLDPGFFSAAKEAKTEEMGVRRVSIPSHATKSPARKQRQKCGRREPTAMRNQVLAWLAKGHML